MRGSSANKDFVIEFTDIAGEGEGWDLFSVGDGNEVGLGEIVGVFEGDVCETIEIAKDDAALVAGRKIGPSSMLVGA